MQRIHEGRFKTEMVPKLALSAVLASISCVATAQRFFAGGDVSEIPQVETAGGHYAYQGQVEDPFAIMRKAGWNFVRFRIWNDPRGGLCDKEYTLNLAKRAQAQGLRISLDFHYSDWWADPGKQYAPAKWRDLPLDEMEAALYSYTKDVVASMIRQGTPPYMVQVGNEITSGMCWPQARLHGEDETPWNHLAGLLSAGIRAVHDAAGKRRILTMIHLDRGGDNKGARWWFDHILREGVKFDAIGLSYYPFWHGHLQAMQDNINDLASRYGKDVYIVETAYPWTTPSDAHQDGAVFDAKRSLESGFPATPEGQAAFLAKVKSIIKAVPHHRGEWLLYWAPTWISATGQKTPYANMATFDYSGAALPAVDVLSAR
jgi:arabinogalactan endo-1,4-beta-galactosidase